MNETAVGKEMYALVNTLFPITRSITGEGVRETLRIIQDHIPIKTYEVPSGTKVFDWTVPKEWNISDAYVMNEAGERVIDFKQHNLHVVGYSTPVDTEMTLEELQGRLYSLPEQPDAIPYVTSYYKEDWGFCIKENERKKLTEGTYRVVINSELKAGSLTYAELIIPGETEEEVFLSSYMCHPSMCNNELSGPVVLTYLAKWLLEQPRRFTYRIVLVPETIGSITYLSSHIEEMQKHVIAGFNLTCVGDDRAYSFMPSRYGDTLADRVSLRVLRRMHPDFKMYSYLERGSDERQYTAPGVELPVCSIMRSKYGEYPEYHTSLDNLELVSPEGLGGAYEAYVACIEEIEASRRYRVTCLGEPQLGKRGLYPTTSFASSADSVQHMMNFIAYADGRNTLEDISERIGVPVKELTKIVDSLLAADLVEEISPRKTIS